MVDDKRKDDYDYLRRIHAGVKRCWQPVRDNATR